MHPEIKQLWRRANELIGSIEQWIQSRDGKRCHITLSKENQLLILRLRTWALRYHIDVTEILDIVVPVLRAQVKKTKFQKPYLKYAGLGLTIKSLCGATAERILTEDIQKRYPNGELLQMWRDSERELQLLREQVDEADGIAVKLARVKSIVEFETAEEYVNQYRRRVDRIRDSQILEGQRKWRRRKMYRGNPWI